MSILHRMVCRSRLIGRMALLKLRREWLTGSETTQTMRLLAVLLVTVNAIALLLLLNLFSDSLRGNVAFAAGLLLTIIVVSLLLDFVPAVQKLGLYRVGFHPTDWIDRCLLWFTTDLISPIQSLLLLSVTVLCLSTAIDPYTGLILFGGVLLARLTSLLIRLRLNFTARVKHMTVESVLVAYACLGTSLALLLLGWQVTLYDLLLSLLLAIGILLLAGRHFFVQPDWAFVQKETKFLGSGTSPIGAWRRLPAKLMVSIGFGFAFKFAFLGLNLLQFLRDGQFLFQAEFLFALFLSPVVCFTYALNNLFSFDPAFYYNVEIRTGRWSVYLRRYLTTVVCCLSVDALLTLTLIWVTLGQAWVLQHLSFYVGAVGLLAGLGLWGSVCYPYAIKAGGITASYRTYTHPVTTLVSMGTVLALYYGAVHLPTFVPIVLGLIGGGGFIFAALRRLSVNRVELIREILN